MQAEGEKQKRPAQPKPGMSDALVNWLTLLLLVVIWGSTFAGITIGVQTIHPAWLVTGRLLGAAAFTAIWIAGVRLVERKRRADARPRVTREAIGWYALIGIVATAAPFFLFATAAKSIGSAVLAICNGATPLGTAILAHFYLRDRLTTPRLVGVVIGFLGLGLLVAPEWGKGEESGLAGIGIAVFGALLYSIGNIATRAAPRLSPVVSSLIIVTCGGLATLVLAALTAPFPTNPSTASLVAVILLALLPTGLAMILYVWLVQRAGPVFVSFTTYMQPLWATGLGVMFLDEPLHWSMIAAIALILFGVAIANARMPAKR